MQFRTLDYNKQYTARSTLTRGTRPDKIIYHSRQCRLARQLTDETTPPTHPISENSSVNDWSRGLLLRQNRLSFQTRAVVPDNSRQDDTLLPPPFPNTARQIGKWLCSQFRAIFMFFVFSLKNFEGHLAPTSYAYGRKTEYSS